MQHTLFDLATKGSAKVSDDGRYRYNLVRWLDDLMTRKPTALFIMLNPSTADAREDDQTIRRCTRFARDWGFGKLIVVNLFGWRATDAGELARAPDPIGPDNEMEIARALRVADLVLCAWGSSTGGILRLKREQAAVICHLIVMAGHTPMCLGTTAAGWPRHPLFVKADVRPMPYTG